MDKFLLYLVNRFLRKKTHLNFINLHFNAHVTSKKYKCIIIFRDVIFFSGIQTRFIL